MTISIGDKVTVNDHYFSQVSEDDADLTEAIKTQATVVDNSDGLLAVRFDNGVEWDKGQSVWHFTHEELNKL